MTLLLQKIRAAILRSLGQGGYPYLEHVAERIGIAPRTLQRRLSVAGTSYTQLVYEQRSGLVTKLLEDPNVPIASIAKKAGFALPSGFSRAFSAWTGIPPSDYRSQLLSPSVRDTYKYNLKVGSRIVHSGITTDLDRREKEHQRHWPNGRIEQIGYRTTADAARKWKATK